MMKILAIETSTEACSCAIEHNGKLFHRFKIAPRQHTQIILPFIRETLNEASITLSQLDAIAFSAGPGSFSGIRIAASVTQGLAFAHDLLVIPISTLATLAQQAYRQFQATKILPALDARMNQVYFGTYGIVNNIATPLINDEVADPDKVTKPKEIKWCALGSGWDVYSEKLSHHLQNKCLTIYPNHYPDAQDMLPIAKNKFEKKEWLIAEKAEPVYLRNNVVN